MLQRIFEWTLWLGWATLLLACNGESHSIRATGPDHLTLTLPAAFGEPWRPAVGFQHDRHTEALAPEDCSQCHMTAEDGTLSIMFKRTSAPADKDAAMDLYHRECITCHEERLARNETTGPLSCAGCHVAGEPAVSSRAELRFDYSLHARHVAAENDKCERCHHIYDDQSRKLVYKKGTESACRDCHGNADDGKTLSWRHAAHTNCIGCHRGRTDGKTGPAKCGTCHSVEAQAAVAKLDPVPRLLRGQSDVAHLHTQGGTAPQVGFDHRQHEPLVGTCADCHHQTLNACSDCHTLRGNTKGGGVTLADAHHAPNAEHSCVGCHLAATKDTGCAGCHDAIPATTRGNGCSVCHSGATTPAEGGGQVGPGSHLAAVTLEPLPGISKAFPREVVIDTLVDQYEASRLPHAKIVRALDKHVRGSVLAKRFHQTAEMVCAGCHHHTPVGARPPACQSCHGEAAAQTDDKPALKAAYHRQCIGCHESMQIDALGCTDCHKESTKGSVQ